MGLLWRRAKRQPEPAQLAPAPAPPSYAQSAALVSPTHVPVRVLVRRRRGSSPVPGVDVFLTPITEFDAPPSSRAAMAAHAGTDGSGVARFLLPPGDYTATVFEDEHETSVRAAVRARLVITVDVDTPPEGGRLPLFVAVRQGGLPVRGAPVRVVAGAPPDVGGVTGRDGTLVLHLRPGAYRLACMGEEADVLHEGSGSVLFALAGIPDEAWEPVEREAPLFGVVPDSPRFRLPLVGERYEYAPPGGTAEARVRVV